MSWLRFSTLFHRFMIEKMSEEETEKELKVFFDYPMQGVPAEFKIRSISAKGICLYNHVVSRPINDPVPTR